MSDTAQSEIHSHLDDPDDVCAVDAEVELLRSIYVHELDIENDENARPQTISIVLHPATADKAEEQFVRLTLVFSLPHLYPRVIPEIKVKNSRGISDEDLKKISLELQIKAEQNVGSQVLYTLIELAKEYLTAKNTPTGFCAICLYGFDPKDVFTKTECYHYFHAQCLARYIQSAIDEMEDSNSKVVCPVCREAIKYDLRTLDAAPASIECESAAEFEITPELKQLQNKMADQFERQLSRGGIIDVEAEKNKYLLEISTTSPTPDDTPPTPKEDVIPVEEKKSTSELATPRNGQTIRKKKPQITNAVSDISENNSTPGGAAINLKNVSQDGYFPPTEAKKYQNRFRGRGKGGLPFFRGNHTDRRELVEAEKHNPSSQPDGERSHTSYERLRYSSRGRGRGRNSGMSWHQQNRRAKNAENRNVDDSIINRVEQPQETKPVEVTKKSSKEFFDTKSVKTNESWGYGPPPLGFVKDVTSPRSLTRTTPMATPPGFRSRPPFPRAKPPPGFTS